MKNNVRIECVETGHVEVMSYQQFYKRFGLREGKELLKGCCSVILAFKTNEPIGVQPNMFTGLPQTKSKRA